MRAGMPQGKVSATLSVAEAERMLDRIAPGYLLRVRRSTAQLGIGGTGLADVHAVLADLRAVAQVSTQASTASRFRVGHVIKAVVKRLVGWYVHFLGSQVNLLGDALVRFGEVMVDRSVELDAVTRRHDADLTALASRVQRLEDELVDPLEGVVVDPAGEGRVGER